MANKMLKNGQSKIQKQKMKNQKWKMRINSDKNKNIQMKTEQWTIEDKHENWEN